MKRKKEIQNSEDRDYQRLVEEETLIFEATEVISELLDTRQVSRKDLAEKLGRSKGFVTQLLSGDRNMTLRTLADLAFALNHRVELEVVPIVRQEDQGEEAPRRSQARVFASTGLWLTSQRRGSGRAAEHGHETRCPAAERRHPTYYLFGSFKSLSQGSELSKARSVKDPNATDFDRIAAG